MVQNRRSGDQLANKFYDWTEWAIRLIIVGAVAFQLNTQRENVQAQKETSQAIAKLAEITSDLTKEQVELKVKIAELNGKQAEMRGQFVSMEMMKRMELLFEKIAAVSGPRGAPLKAMADVLKMEREARSQQ